METPRTRPSVAWKSHRHTSATRIRPGGPALTGSTSSSGNTTSRATTDSSSVSGRAAQAVPTTRRTRSFCPDQPRRSGFRRFRERWTDSVARSNVFRPSLGFGLRFTGDGRIPAPMGGFFDHRRQLRSGTRRLRPRAARERGGSRRRRRDPRPASARSRRRAPRHPPARPSPWSCPAPTP